MLPVQTAKNCDSMDYEIYGLTLKLQKNEIILEIVQVCLKIQWKLDLEQKLQTGKKLQYSS